MATPAGMINGPNLQLEPELAGTYLVRRKDGGRVIARLTFMPGGMPVLQALPLARRVESSEVLVMLRPLLGRRAILHVQVSAGADADARRTRRYRLRLHGQGAAARHLPDWRARLGIDPDYGTRLALDAIAEPALLQAVGHDRWGRRHWLVEDAARAWRCMHEAASREGLELEIVSSFRSVAHQAAIIRRKLQQGQSLQQILAVNAAPGYSEHHSGRAIDLATPDTAPAETEFEATEAFDWLTRHAGRFGFAMSYPRDNPWGFIYEPWHWCWHPSRGAAPQPNDDPASDPADGTSMPIRRPAD